MPGGQSLVRLHHENATSPDVPSADRGRTGHVAVPDADVRLVSLRDIWGLISNSLLFLIAALLIGAFIGWGLGVIREPSYKAESLMVIETQSLAIPELQTVVSNRTQEPWGGRSAAQVLSSRDLIGDVVKDLALQHDPDFNGSLRPGMIETIASINWLPDVVRGWLSSLQNSDEPTYNINQIIDDTRKNLATVSEERSYAINLSFVGQDPQSSALFLNALMDTYIQKDVERKKAATSKAQTELKARIDALFGQLEDTRKKIRALESQDDLVTSEAGTLSAQELQAINAERRTINLERAAVISDRRQVDSAISSGSVGLLTSSLLTPKLRALAEDQNNIVQNMAELSSSLGARHPQMVLNQTRLESIQDEIAGELNNLRRSLTTRIAAYNQQLEEIDNQVDAARSTAALSAEGRSLLTQLRDEAKSQQELYDVYRSRYEQVLANIELFQSDARVASYASPPLEPSSPSSSILAVACSAISLLLAGGFLIVRHWLHDGVTNIDELNALSGKPTLGGIPVVNQLIPRDGKVSEQILKQPNGAVTETVRGILFQIQQAKINGRTPKVVAITSPLPRDGKSSLATSIARVAARDGINSLVIDADFRNPSLAKHLGVKATTTFNDVLEHTYDLDEAVFKDPKGSADFLLSRPVAVCSKAFLEQKRLRDTIDLARLKYDLVVIDTPPVMKVIDPLVLCGYCDAIVMVVSWREVSRQIIRQALQRLDAVNVPLIGMVLSRIGGKVPESYVYGGYATAAE